MGRDDVEADEAWAAANGIPLICPHEQYGLLCICFDRFRPRPERLYRLGVWLLRSPLASWNWTAATVYLPGIPR